MDKQEKLRLTKIYQNLPEEEIIEMLLIDEGEYSPDVYQLLVNEIKNRKIERKVQELKEKYMKEEAKAKPKREIVNFIIIMAVSSLLVSFLVKTYVARTWQKVAEEKLGHNPSSTTQSPLNIKKGRCFEDEIIVEELNQAIKEDPLNADLYNKKGNRYLLEKDFQKAIEEFDKAIKINPNYAEPYNGKGVAYRNLGEYYMAIENYTKAIELDPAYFEAYNNRGVCFVFLEKNNKACFDFEKACELGSCQKLEISKQKMLCE